MGIPSPHRRPMAKNRVLVAGGYSVFASPPPMIAQGRTPPPHQTFGLLSPPSHRGCWRNECYDFDKELEFPLSQRTLSLSKGGILNPKSTSPTESMRGRGVNSPALSVAEWVGESVRRTPMAETNRSLNVGFCQRGSSKREIKLKNILLNLFLLPVHPQTQLGEGWMGAVNAL